MENLVYWQGKAVGIEVNGKVLFFTGAPAEAVVQCT